MDETDVALCRLLVYNSRTPYSELAKAPAEKKVAMFVCCSDILLEG